MKGCVISAPMTGSGKTTVTLGLLASLRKRRIAVQPFKVGPDFIDPGLHELAAGIPSHNLDGWMLTRDANWRLFAHATEGRDVAVVEGVMGLFDGFDGKSETGSTAEMALWLDLPVVVVIDAHPMARSAAAVIYGLRLFDPRVKIAGLIFNRVAGESHYRILADAVTDVPVLGWLPANPSIEIPERRLGLFTAKEELVASRIRTIGEFFDAHVSVDNILNTLPGLPSPPPNCERGMGTARVKRVALACDKAFSFYYHANRLELQNAGAEIIEFSPLSDHELPQADFLYIGGGYPELYRKQLEANASMRASIRRYIESGKKFYAECGGLMYLAESIDGAQMVGIVPIRIEMTKRLVDFGYCEVKTNSDSILGPAGTMARGHQFHHSRCVGSSGNAYHVTQGQREYSEGFCLSERCCFLYSSSFPLQSSARAKYVKFMNSVASMTQPYEAVIGLECHAQLLTKSKLFCSCSTKFGEAPNVNTCPVCLGLPGALPVLNRAAVTMAVKAAFGLNCEINLDSQWARKNYFYPDLPKGYQISQYDRPLAQHGFIEIKVEGTHKRIGVQRVHMEEDAGKSLHEGFSDSSRYTYLDFNRSGVPLIEIVTNPDIRSSAEAYDYLVRLKQILEYLDVCDGNMEEGSLRCDANVSVRKVGEQKLGTRTELKNINSFRFVQKAIDYEVNRQVGVIESGGRVVQETRLWNSIEERTVSMRSKEEAHDYRYFPDPDLPLLTVDADWIKTVQRSMPELPELRRQRFVKEYALSEYDAGVLTTTRALGDFFDEAVRLSNQPKTAANWMMGDLLRFCKDNNVDLKDLSDFPVTPKMLSDMISLVERGTISGKIAKTIMEDMYKTGKSPQQIIEEKGLVQISNTDEIDRIVSKVIEENPKPVEQYRLGKTGNFGFFVGQVMKATGGRANPQTVNEILKKRLAG